MNNLKRVLSLALASVMLIGMMAVGASATDVSEFSDGEKITHVEAVDVMSTLGVIEGNTDGTYAPERILKRGEMTAIIARLLNGGKSPSLGTSTSPMFTDVVNHWSRPYVEYCANLGIVNGMGDGTFRPEDPLTGAQAAKMLLCAAGFRSDIYKFTGPEWELNVNRIASQQGLYKELENVTANTTEGLKRDDAAQMAYNTLPVNPIVENYTQNLATGTTTVQYVKDSAPNDTMLGKYFKSNMEVGYLVGYTYDDVKNTWEYTFQKSAVFGGDTLTATNAIADNTKLTSTEDFTGFFGQQVEVIYADKALQGVFAHNSTVLAEGVTGEIAVGSTTVTVGSASVKTDSGTLDDNTVYLVNTTAKTGETFSDLEDKDAPFRFKAIDNDADGKLNAIVYYPVTISKISYVGSSAITLAAPYGASVKLADVDIYEGYAKDDWTVYTAKEYTPTQKARIEKIDLQTGTVTATKGTTTISYRVGDADWYAKSTTGISNIAAFALNDEIEFVSLGDYIYYAKVVEKSTTSKDIALVITAGNDGASTLTNSYKATLLFADGTTSTVTLANVDGKTPADTTALYNNATTGTAAVAVGHLVTYRTNSDGAYILTTISATNLAGHTGTANNTKYTVAGSSKTLGGKNIADDAVIFVFQGTESTANAANKGKIITGKQLKTLTTTGQDLAGGVIGGLTDTVNGFETVSVGVVDSTSAVTINTGSNYGYITAGAIKIEEDGKSYYQFSLWTGTETLTNVKYEFTTEPIDAFQAGTVITYNVKSEGVLTSINVVPAVVNQVKAWDGSKNIQFTVKTLKADLTQAAAAGATLTVDSDTVIMAIASGKGVEGASVANIQLASDVDGDGTIVPFSSNENSKDPYNVRVVSNDAGTHVDFLLIDASNSMGAAPKIYLAGDATAEGEIAALLTAATTVEATGTTTKIAGALAIGKGKTVIISDSAGAELADDVTGNGTLSVVKFDSGATSSAHVQNAIVKVTDTATGINDATIKAAADAMAGAVGAGAKLTLAANSSDNVNTVANFYPTNGTALTGSVKIPKGTYTYYAANSIDKADGSGKATHAAGWYTAAAVDVVDG